jgi:hypothetical protein
MMDDENLKAYREDCVRIMPEAIQEEFVRIPADLGFWNERYAQALRAFLLSKLGRDETEARLYLHHRERMAAAGHKASEAQVDAAVRSDPEMHEANMRVVDAQVDYQRARGTVDAVSAKKDMVTSLGAQLRTEMEGDLVLRNRIAGTGGRT